MPSPFPGMNPYLEDPQLWPEVHSRLIVAMADRLNPQVMPKYRVAVERRVYEILEGESITVGIPDVSVSRSSQRTAELPAASAAIATQPRRILLPTPEEIRESYLEIREVATGSVVTVIELLSPKNKKAGPGRDAYETKRLRLLSSNINFVEIDLLRAGCSRVNFAPGESPLYCAIVSPWTLRPEADLYAFSLQEEMPTLTIPLQAEDPGVTLDLQQVVDETYDRAGLDLAIDYSQPPPPPQLNPEDQAWVASILNS
jgi:hypothetical protein